MKFYSPFDKEFAPYGRVLEGYDTKELCEEMSKIPMPDGGVNYEASVKSLEKCDIFNDLTLRGFGGMDTQLGFCWGYNTKLNALEYHRCSEINVGTGDFVLLLARQDEIIDGKLDVNKVKAFLVPAGVIVEVYATSLHYAPCGYNDKGEFRVAIVLLKGTNLEKPVYEPKGFEDKLNIGRNKWLIAHPDSHEAEIGFYVGIVGENIDISK